MALCLLLEPDVPADKKQAAEPQTDRQGKYQTKGRSGKPDTRQGKKEKAVTLLGQTDLIFTLPV